MDFASLINSETLFQIAIQSFTDSQKSLVPQKLSALLVLDLRLVRSKQQVELDKANSKLKALTTDEKSGYHMMNVNNKEVVAHEGKIYVPLSLQWNTMKDGTRRVLTNLGQVSN